MICFLFFRTRRDTEVEVGEKMSIGGGGSRTRVLKCDTKTSTGIASSYKFSAQGWRSSMAFLTPETAFIFPAFLQTFKQVSPGL